MSQVRDTACPNEIVFYRHFQVNYLELSWTILNHLTLSCTILHFQVNGSWTMVDENGRHPVKMIQSSKDLPENDQVEITKSQFSFEDNAFDGFHSIYYEILGESVWWISYYIWLNLGRLSISPTWVWTTLASTVALWGTSTVGQFLLDGFRWSLFILNPRIWIDLRTFQTICPKINMCIKTCANNIYLTCQVVHSLPTPSYLTTTYMAGGVRSAYPIDQ